MNVCRLETPPDHLHDCFALSTSTYLPLLVICLSDSIYPDLLPQSSVLLLRLQSIFVANTLTPSRTSESWFASAAHPTPPFPQELGINPAALATPPQPHLKLHLRCIANMALKFAPFGSEIDLPFYTALSQSKIDHDKLDDSARTVIGLYEPRIVGPEDSCRMRVLGNALTSDE